MSSNDFVFDDLKMYCGLPYSVLSQNENLRIVIHQPKIKEIINIGERLFFQNIYMLIGNTTMYRYQLWMANIDWCTTSDYKLFCMRCKEIDPTILNMIFGGTIDFSNFEAFEVRRKDGDDTSSDIGLFDIRNGLEFSEETYLEVREYLRAMFNFHPKDEFARNKATKIAIIEQDETDMKIAAQQGENKPKSTLLPLISFALNHPGFKYNLDELMNLGINQFMDSVQRLQSYESTRALYGGMYSGFCDLSKQLKTDPDLLNFAKDLSYNEKKNIDTEKTDN